MHTSGSSGKKKTIIITETENLQRMRKKSILNSIDLGFRMINYNLRIIFANKFIWFLAGSVLFYLGLSVIYVFDSDVTRMSDLYGVFIFSGILLVFYPSV